MLSLATPPDFQAIWKVGKDKGVVKGRQWRSGQKILDSIKEERWRRKDQKDAKEEEDEEEEEEQEEEEDDHEKRRPDSLAP